MGLGSCMVFLSRLGLAAERGGRYVTNRTNVRRSQNLRELRQAIEQLFAG
jgi:hypothetical protein